MSVIEKICQANSRDEVHQALQSISLIDQYKLLKNSIDVLNTQIESDVISQDTESALMKMSRVVMLEDELHIVERVILKEGVLV